MGNLDKKYIDLDSALARLGGNINLYHKLLEKFESSFDMLEFEHALQVKDYESAGGIVHIAKGVAGNLSLDAFYKASQDLMDQLREGSAPNQEQVELFKQYFKETISAIQEYLA
ncbi:MAG: Hpt domain-containing protein [Clostridiales Family XIII bacterium]|jgi:HPt (histidine-containing phosphotransfer) domain-containing protein|nr:Hpt domain-containing protein [Clostridiales Family XIII bacterium]